MTLLAFPAEPAPPIRFTDEQRSMIRGMIARANGKPISEEELAPLLAVAELRRLNPLLKQIWFVLRAGQWMPMVSVDGMRLIAQRSGTYAGQDAPEFVHDEAGRLVSCIVRVYRRDWGDRPATGHCFLAEYADPRSPFWRDKPHVMLSKVAEVSALRKAFPDEASNLYSPEELDRALPEFTPAPGRVAPKAAASPRPPAVAPPLAVTSDGEIVDDGSEPAWRKTFDVLRHRLERAASMDALRAVGLELKAAIQPERGAGRIPPAPFHELKEVGAKRRLELEEAAIREDDIPF